MREFKFRAWEEIVDKRKNCKGLGKFCMSYFDFYMADIYALKDTVMQYTGLKDKNGKEVYEGDIVKYESSLDYGIAEIRPVLDTCNMAFWWIKQKTKNPRLFDEINYFCCSKELEIIGNIYENPEILGKE